MQLLESYFIQVLFVSATDFSAKVRKAQLCAEISCVHEQHLTDIGLQKLPLPQFQSEIACTLYGS